MRSLLAYLLLVACATTAGGCAQFTRRKEQDYRTVVQAPNRDTAKARRSNERARKLLDHRKLEKAELALQEALVADVTYGPAHNNLGKVYYLQGKYYLAAWEFEYASRLMPRLIEPYNNLGLVYEAVERLPEAVATYESAFALDPDNPHVIGNLARARLRVDQADESVPYLLRELVLYDTRPDWVEWARDWLGTHPIGSSAENSDESSAASSADEPIPPPTPDPVPWTEPLTGSS